jgi:hypothetical protein
MAGNVMVRPGRVPAGRILFRQRLLLAVTLTVALISIANIYLNLGLVGRFPKHAIAAVFIAMYLQIRFYAPSLFRLRAYRRLKKRQDSKAASVEA